MAAPAYIAVKNEGQLLGRPLASTPARTREPRFPAAAHSKRSVRYDIIGLGRIASGARIEAGETFRGWRHDAIITVNIEHDLCSGVAEERLELRGPVTGGPGYNEVGSGKTQQVTARGTDRGWTPVINPSTGSAVAFRAIPAEVKGGNASWVIAVALPRSRRELRYALIVEEYTMMPADEKEPEDDAVNDPKEPILRRVHVTYASVLDFKIADA